MIDVFKKQLISHGFNTDETEQLCQSAKWIELPTRHILLHQGEVAQEIHFLLEGICHSAYLTEKGKEFSKEFYWEKRLDHWVRGPNQATTFTLPSRISDTLLPRFTTDRDTAKLARGKARYLSQIA